MADERVQHAVRNNAVWCDSVCRAHGRPGVFRDGIWVNRHPVPRFYPNAVTLAAAQPETQLADIRDLREAGIPGEWGVKDSFGCLDLASLGFRVLFRAQWIWRRPAPPEAGEDVADARWVRIRQAPALAEWETAWGGASHSDQERIFLPALLADARIAVVAAYHGNRIIAGAIANRATDVVGLSNLFVPAHDGERFWAGCVAAVGDAFPQLPIVGYVTDGDLGVAGALGFETIGALRVWVGAPQ